MKDQVLTISAMEFLRELVEPQIIDDEMIFQILRDCKTDEILIRKSLAALNVKILKWDWDENLTYIYTNMSENQYDEIRHSGK